MKKIILVTGASSGLGLAMARALAARGHIVYGTSRDISAIADLSFKRLEMDVTDNYSVKDAIRSVLEAEGKIDVLINNAGNGIAGPLYAMPAEIAKRQFEVNFFGVVRVSSAVLPGMIVEKQGLVINIGSFAGLFGLPYQGLYSASKFALEGYTESLRMELKGTGINITMVNSGKLRTKFIINREKLPFTLDNLRLKRQYEAAVDAMERCGRKRETPENFAEKICGIVAASNPRHRYHVGSFGQLMMPVLKKVLPGELFIKLMNRHYGIS